jgi:hypothetical protein
MILLLLLIQALLIGLKLSDAIDWDWVWVLLPIWVGLVIMMLYTLLFISTIVLMLGVFFVTL